MKSEGETAANRYCAELKKHCPRAFRNRILPGIKNDVKCFFDSDDSMTYDTLAEHFGRPENFAASCIGEMSQSEKVLLLNQFRWIKAGIIAATVALAIVLTVTVIIVGNNNSKPLIYSSGSDYSTKAE